MANVRKIRKWVTRTVVNSLEELEEVTVNALIPFHPPVCGTCHQEMKNVNTVDGKRRFGCMTWGCNNRHLYTEDGTQIGQNSRHTKSAA